MWLANFYGSTTFGTILKKDCSGVRVRARWCDQDCAK